MFLVEPTDDTRLQVLVEGLAVVLAVGVVMVVILLLVLEAEPGVDVCAEDGAVQRLLAIVPCLTALISLGRETSESWKKLLHNLKQIVYSIFEIL